jgi:hypothetical protein
MLARGDEAAVVERRVAAFRAFMERAYKECWADHTWDKPPLPAREQAVPRETPEQFARRRAAILLAMDGRVWEPKE